MVRNRTRTTLGSLGIVAAIAAAGFAVSRGSIAAQSQAAPAAPTARSGEAVYSAHCAECHGESGKGDGPASFLLLPRPRDFSTGAYKIRSTETGSIPTDDDLLKSVRKGLYGSAMPAWETLLPDAEIRNVVEYVKAFSPAFRSTHPQVLPTGAEVTSSPASVARGANVYQKLRCGSCHGSDGRGTNAVATEFKDDWGQPLHAADLTEPWTFRGGATTRDVYLRFRAGMSGTPMPSFKDSASDAEMWDLANYVTSLARKPVWSMNAAELAEFYAHEEAEAKANPIERGRYLVDALACSLCHSPVDESRRIIPGMKLAGGRLIRIEPFGDYPTGNLTSDLETGLGGWTDDEILQVMTRGILRDGTRLLPYPMDWPAYSTMKPDDLKAIIVYLRTVPAVSNRVPPPTRPLLPMYLWGKFNMLILGGDPPMTFYAGNAGTPETGGR